ncbi:peptidoglycan DD-metalloendopeptidase family protein [Faecalibacterium duncaniae]|uniref:murein hydrolase activator EnvC family protein n=1 Tax=Faecalibacterium duncaniae (strain DSM 17677 / JCM 31915 / A2-165) TaxID=411483 RepID=UPI0029413AE0|nr:peptidoglycan DD-metalloendopeptidase family protein [Faecalibacterium duncaniae]MDV5094093.1 peptidoglycan DD-metalloendopeptidase family protein [Faecalibacterium duncaniae]
MKQAKHSAGFRLHLMYTPTHAKPASGHSRAMRAASLFLAAACLLLSVSVYPATAATSMSSLQNKLDKLSQSIVQHKKELSNAKKKEQAAKALESELKEKVTVVQSQISVLKGQIAEVQNSIGLKEQEIAVKEQQITEKEAEIADQWGDFKQHMAAMQELRDGGSVAMLSAVNDLYELLTFNEVMQDISIKDTEILDNMKNAKEALESDKLTLESQRSELQSKKADLDAQNSQMRAKQNELNSSVAAAQMSAAEAQQAQKDAQAAIESDEMNYEAVKKQIQKMIAAAAASKPTLSFTGFICPLKSYSRISSEYGWRKNPVTGVNKLHAGTDFAAPGGTPIYAAASGYVQVAGWSSGGYGNYVIIYHGKMSDGNQYSTLYGHMRSVATSAGKYVQQGEIIGYVGSTGNSTGNHLHLEVWKGGSKANAVNPRGYIPMK